MHGEVSTLVRLWFIFYCLGKYYLHHYGEFFKFQTLAACTNIDVHGMVDFVPTSIGHNTCTNIDVL